LVEANFHGEWPEHGGHARDIGSVFVFQVFHSERVDPQHFPGMKWGIPSRSRRKFRNFLATHGRILRIFVPRPTEGLERHPVTSYWVYETRCTKLFEQQLSIKCFPPFETRRVGQPIEARFMQKSKA
jgi:hypothetical protein